ncbi:MAG TPA: HU family DNA-binding protein, partial [Massilibacterium sp.]|nr:HU family DNA-binding protein [Massilibacterium sp.]
MKENKSMNKSELIHQVKRQVKMPKKDVALVIDTMLNTITDTLQKGETIQIMGFGSFEVRFLAARKGRNPKTGEEIQIKARKKAAFKPG